MNIYIRPETEKSLRQLGADQDCSVSEVIRRLAEQARLNRQAAVMQKELRALSRAILEDTYGNIVPDGTRAAEMLYELWPRLDSAQRMWYAQACGWGVKQLLRVGLAV